MIPGARSAGPALGVPEQSSSTVCPCRVSPACSSAGPDQSSPHPRCQGSRGHQLPFHTRERAALPPSPCHNPIKALLADSSLSPGMLLRTSSAAIRTAPVPATSPWQTSHNFLSPDIKQECPAAPPLTGD